MQWKRHIDHDTTVASVQAVIWRGHTSKQAHDTRDTHTRSHAVRETASQGNQQGGQGINGRERDKEREKRVWTKRRQGAPSSVAGQAKEEKQLEA